MKRGPQKRENKLLSKTGLLKVIQDVFKKITTKKTSKKGRPNLISLFDCLMSAVAVFSLKSPSLLAFDRARKEKALIHNLKQLYGVEQVPSDTYLREVLDDLDPREIRKAYTAIFQQIQRGKLLVKYHFLGGYLLCYDGTEIFSSEEVHCNNCCEKKHKDGRVTYYHQIFAASIVHPNVAQVIPLCPEPISKLDGESKNDCESNAAKRFFNDLKKEHPNLKLTVTSDALFANTPHINRLIADGFDFIIVIKPGSNKSLFEWLNGATLREVQMTVGKKDYKFRYINEIPLNDAKNAPNINYFDVKETEVVKNKTIEKSFSWATSHKISSENIFELMQGGRAKWKIENETFNTLKNQGYQFEHNFGHGEKHLHTVFALLMMLAFLIDQVQESTDGLFQAALQKMGSRRALWERIRSFFHIALIDSWEALFNTIGLELNEFVVRCNSS